MALLCYNKGCGLKYDGAKNKEDTCVFHPGVPIFHDALKGWSCCKKRTTDFSEFLAIKGCTRGRHSNVKPQEPLLPEVSSEKGDMKHSSCQEIIYQGPNSDEARMKLPHKVSASLAQALEKLDLSTKAEYQKKESQTVMPGTRCKNAGCKTKGCSTGVHRWVPKQDKKKVACRYDWHQTGDNVIVTIYAKNANPKFSSIEANGTVLSCQIQFENDKIFKKDFRFWGVVNVKQSSVNMVPSKVEVTLRKADKVAWGKLEDPNYKPDPEPIDDSFTETTENQEQNYDIEDDDISDSDEEWAYDTKQNQTQEQKNKEELKKNEDAEIQNLKRKEVEEEMKKVSEERKRAEEEKKKLEEQRRQEEGEGYEDMPELE
ncbi:Cysteine and histidine-rich domain containing protein 1 [Dissostichus eleginoides]|uniref:Cysteine and histidine-rich domain containing protein 1 n=1 Tax=Dissostichus eleginoides TaxID=100907 RepID=A0AAD9F635_DISEL|nr:Cysteine and histidine-rich domain containing protein 1 [Dissostichus eleginoides]